jgi:septal ring factor EnvC (AmiA/AmiB activator)
MSDQGETTMKTHLIAGLAALTLLGACASAAAAPAVSSNISAPDLDRKEMKQWNKAEKDIRKGGKLVAEGSKDLEKGEEMVRKARQALRKGEDKVADAEADIRKGERLVADGRNIQTRLEVLNPAPAKTWSPKS